MDAEEFYSGERCGPAPRKIPVVAVSEVRVAGKRGREFRLARDPQHTIVRVTGRRITIGPNHGMLSDDGDGPQLELTPVELRALLRIGNAWAKHRNRWAAFTAGGFAFMAPMPLSYRPRRWSAVRLNKRGDVRAGEADYRPTKPAHGERLGSYPVEHAIENGLGERAGVVLRGPNDLCITLARGSFVASRAWPRSSADLGEVAAFLIREANGGLGEPGDPGPLGHLGSDAAEIDVLGLLVLREAAGDLARTTRSRRSVLVHHQREDDR